MPRYIALLRSIVIAKHRPTSSILRGWAVAIGGLDVCTVVSTGNLIFTSAKRPATIARELEAACSATFGAATNIIVKTAAEWRTLMEANPFSSEAELRPANLVAWVMRTPLPDYPLVRLLERASVAEKVARVGSGDLYIWYGAGDIKASRLPAICTPTGFGAIGTGRNWNTVCKIAAML